MTQIKGAGIFLAQFMGENAPFDSLENICQWASDLGYKGIQIPSWDTRCIDLKQAAESTTYCEELIAKVKSYGLEISELSTHLQGQLVAVHPTYDLLFDGFAPDACKNNPKARQAWAVDQLILAAKASKNLNLKAHATFSGALIWPTVYPWPQRPAGLVEEGFKELAKRWTPILDAYAENGIDLCYEIHPGEDLHDGITFERFLEATNHHSAIKILYDPSHLLLQQMDYLSFINHYHQYIKMFHVKDAEYLRSGKSGVYGGYQNWQDRPGRFRSLGDGQIDFKSIFSLLTKYDYDGWAVMEWECCFKSPEQGAREGAPFIEKHLIETSERAFDDFADAEVDKDMIKKLLGL